MSINICIPMAGLVEEDAEIDIGVHKVMKP